MPVDQKSGQKGSYCLVDLFPDGEVQRLNSIRTSFCNVSKEGWRFEGEQERRKGVVVMCSGGLCGF